MIECPKCGEKMELVASIPNESKIKMRFESEDDLFSAKTLGGLITDAEKLFCAVAREMKQKVHVTISEISKNKNFIEIEFAIIKISREGAHHEP